MTSKRTYAKTHLLGLLPPVPLSPWWATVKPCLRGDPQTLTGRSVSVSCGVTDPFPWVLVHTRFCLCPPRVCFPSVCKFWWLYGGFNGDLLQERLCHTQIHCAQSPCLCGRPLLTCTSTRDTQTLFWLSLCGVSGSWCTQGVFEPSECLWWV